MIPDDIERLQQMISHGGTEMFDLIPGALNKIILEKQWLERVDKDGKAFTSFEAFVTHRLWQGLETTIDELLLYCRKKKKVRKLVEDQMDKAPTLADRQRDGKGRIHHSNTTVGRGSTYTKKRLKRDRPDLFELVLAGQLSANAAAIQAGWRKKKTPLEQLLYWWQKCTDEERMNFEQALHASQARGGGPRKMPQDISIPEQLDSGLAQNLNRKEKPNGHSNRRTGPSSEA